MKRFALFSFALLILLGTALSAQFFTETFSYPNGTTIPGWATVNGTWQITNGRLTATGSGWRYINKSGTLTKDCVLDGEFFLIGSAIQFGGLTARHPGGTSTSSLVMCKIQNNSTPGPVTAFTRCYIYEQPGTSLYQDVPVPRPVSAYCRMIVADNSVWMLTDADKDGVFEMSTGPFTVATVTHAGLAGMNSYGACEMDNFKYYNAVVINDAANPKPQPGSALRFNLRGIPSSSYQAASSFGRSGIPIGGGVQIPLSADPLFFLSASNVLPAVFSNYAGLLDPSGSGSVGVKLPQAAALVGISIFTAIVTYDRFGINGVSNDHLVIIVP